MKFCRLHMAGKTIQSPPTRGAWIEIAAIYAGVDVGGVAPYEGGVD